jgi:hypothetical protein
VGYEVDSSRSSAIVSVVIRDLLYLSSAQQITAAVHLGATRDTPLGGRGQNVVICGAPDIPYLRSSANCDGGPDVSRKG